MFIKENLEGRMFIPRICLYVIVEVRDKVKAQKECRGRGPRFFMALILTRFFLSPVS
jgi:hypothetical protein